ncbi:uncharacterized protein B0I36DRAFT_241772 [Microdochium trichocladiopsis]|uniref:Uncharacterized protein n=1 Tax=Microdochium trichocladiopsis TaxID=1682393 RepID=A0A9P8Y9V0_9PEZI|nr:uncharacterized protein B0I36DRAFT_241772 [Microdochium trichocladiopsis]KAH7033737.1 hypothetical protein B0I36DRAFT_241772 [Microdochium trichocladiopsis]
MLLIYDPDKQGIDPETLNQYPDADLSWCFDFLHAHARLKGPDEKELPGISESHSWSLESYGGFSLCMHFTLHRFYQLSEHTPTLQEHPLAAGLQCSRRQIHTHFAGTFYEDRTTIVIRMVTTRDNHGRAKDPATTEGFEVVGFTLDDGWGRGYRWENGDWSDKSLVCPDEARGVAVFQHLLWKRFIDWQESWQTLLHRLRTTMDIDDHHLASDSKILDSLMRDDDASTKSKQYFTTIKLMRTFRKHMAATPPDLADMREHWTRTFPGHTSAIPSRFSSDTQQALNKNWDHLEAHLGELHHNLEKLSREIEAEAREAWRDVSVR